MPNSYSSLAYHIVFGTKYREPTLKDPICVETYACIGGIIGNKKGQTLGKFAESTIMVMS